MCSCSSMEVSSVISHAKVHQVPTKTGYSSFITGTPEVASNIFSSIVSFYEVPLSRTVVDFIERSKVWNGPSWVGLEHGRQYLLSCSLCTQAKHLMICYMSFAVPTKQTVQEIMALQIFLFVVHSYVFWLQGKTYFNSFSNLPGKKRWSWELTRVLVSWFVLLEKVWFCLFVCSFVLLIEKHENKIMIYDTQLFVTF